MHPLLVLLHLSSSVLLLIWAVRMVRTGVERGYGAALKRALRGARSGQAHAAASGIVLALVLQSSTAVGVLASGFAASGIISVTTGLAALLGADLGSALVVQVLSFDLTWLIPVLLLFGTTIFLKFEQRSARQLGRILLGVAFILLSLQMIGLATEPLRESSALPQVATYFRNDPLTAFALALGFTWLIHSSIATILLLLTFVSQGVFSFDVALPMVIGANVGGPLIAVWLTRTEDIAGRSIPMGNFIFRSVVAIITMLVVISFGFPNEVLGETEARQLVNFHLAFNGVLLAACLPFTEQMGRLTNWLLTKQQKGGPTTHLPKQPKSALDRSVIAKPHLALASATRECLRMGETVELMFRPIVDLLDGLTVFEPTEIRHLDQQVSRSHTSIKLFIAEVNGGLLKQEEAQRGIELTDFAINMEHISDIIAKTIVPLVNEKKKKSLSFSDDGWNEITSLHSRVLANMQLAFNVLVSGDVESARQLVREKELVRKLERESHDKHLRRLQSRMVESIDTSSIHLQIVRSLKEVNSLLATVGYPILSQSGHLLDSRLVQAD